MLMAQSLISCNYSQLTVVYSSDECEDDIYLLPIEPTSKPDPPSIQGRRLPGLQQPTPQSPSPSKNVPWKSGRHNIVTDSQSPKPPGERGPASLPHQFTSQSKVQ